MTLSNIVDKKLSKSSIEITNHVKLLENDEENIGYNSFEVLEILGQGTFGKVFRVKKKNAD